MQVCPAIDCDLEVRQSPDQVASPVEVVEERTFEMVILDVGGGSRRELRADRLIEPARESLRPHAVAAITRQTPVPKGRQPRRSQREPFREEARKAGLGCKYRQ